MTTTQRVQSIQDDIDEIQRGVDQLEKLEGSDIPVELAVEIQTLFEAKKATINYQIRELLSENGESIGDQISEIDELLTTLSGKVRQALNPQS